MERSNANDQTQAPEPEPFKDDEPAKVLVVDDEPAILDIFADFLTLEGFDVKLAANGEEALHMLESEHSFDLVVTDLEMPKMNGMELLREIHGRAYNCNTILMTAYATVETAIEAMKIGAFDYILKPFKMSEVTIVVRRAVNNLRLRNENIQLKEIVNLYSISEAIEQSLDMDEILSIIVDASLREFSADLVVLQMHDLKADAFSQFWPRPRDVSGWREICHALRDDVLMRFFESHQPVVARGDGVAEFCETEGPASVVRSYMAVPIRVKDRVTGWLNVFSFDPHRPLTEGMRKTLALIVARASGAIEKSVLLNDLKRAFRDTIESLGAALEAKDEYTRGHSERVGHYCRIIGEGFGLSAEECERLYHAGRLHDIGKIGVDLEMINKPSALDQRELAQFRRHPVLSKQILEPVGFLHDLVPMVAHHHERWDGKGYPDKLAGEDIPFGARVICVADAFHVMTSDRPYRKRMSYDDAIAEIKRCSGTQFDPRIVEVFLRQLDRHGEREIKERREALTEN